MCECAEVGAVTSLRLPAASFICTKPLKLKSKSKSKPSPPPPPEVRPASSRLATEDCEDLSARSGGSGTLDTPKLPLLFSSPACDGWLRLGTPSPPLGAESEGGVSAEGGVESERCGVGCSGGQFSHYQE